MPRRQEGAGVSGIRALLIAEWDHGMKRWRIPGYVYAYEEALKGGSPVIISANRLLRAFSLAGLPGNRFGFGGVDHGKQFLLDGDDLSVWHSLEDGQEVITE